MLERYLGFPKQTHRYIFLGATFLIAIALPVSYFALSVGQIVLGSNWIVEGDLRRKLRLLVQRKSILVFLGIYLVHLLGTFKGGDWGYIIHDLKIKLPLMGLPLVYATTAPLNEKEVKTTGILFILSVLTGTFICYAVSLGYTQREIVDYRDISIFISHIRFSLMIVFAICLSFMYAVQSYATDKRATVGLLAILVWMMYFLSLLGAMTGIVILTLVFPLTWIVYAGHNLSNRIYRWSLLVMAILSLGLITYIGYSINRFYEKKPVDLKNLEKYTVNGNRYIHQTRYTETENGYLVYIYNCPIELEKEWNLRSPLPYDSTDKSGQLIEYTLYRYMTSMGLTKDSVGMSQLSDEDITLIENGFANYLYKHKIALYPKIHRVLWEIEYFRKYGDPNYKSVLQRYEFLKTGWNLHKRFPVFGTGNGHLVQEFNRQYEMDNSPLVPEKRFRAHNQMFTFLITFGLAGFLIILIAHIYPVVYERKFQRMEFVIFYAILLLSYLNEDTLETHAGVSFAGFFIGLFLFATQSNRNG